MNQFNRNILRLWPNAQIPEHLPPDFSQPNIMELLKHNNIMLPNDGMVPLSYNDLQWASILMAVCMSAYPNTEIQHPTLLMCNGVPSAICGIKWFQQQWWISIVGYNNQMVPYDTIPLAQQYINQHLPLPILTNDLQNLWRTPTGQDIHEVDTIHGCWKFYDHMLPTNIKTVEGDLFHWNTIQHECTITGTLITKSPQQIPHLIVQ